MKGGGPSAEKDAMQMSNDIGSFTGILKLAN